MASITCPRCNVMVEIKPTVIYGEAVDVRRSNPRETYRIDAAYEVEAHWEDEQRPGYTIIDCGNCTGRFVVEHEKRGPYGDYGQTTVVSPLPGAQVEIEIPEIIGEALEDAKKAHGVGAEIAALLAARTTLIRLQREQGVQSLTELKDAGKLTSVLYQQADEVRLWANMQGHNDLPPGKIQAQDVEELLEYLDTVLRTIYVDPARLKKRQEERKDLKGSQSGT